MKSSHMIEPSSENIEATMKIDEIPHYSRQTTNRMTQEQEFLQSQEDGQQQNPTLMLKKDEITREYQEWCTMQKACKSIKTWNTLQPGNEMEWLKITKDFLNEFPKVNSKQKLQIIVSLMQSHVDAKHMTLSKLQQAIDDDKQHPLEQFFRWMSINYGLRQGRKIKQLQKSLENRDFSWKLNPADESDAALREAQISLKEIMKNMFLSNIHKEHMRKTMSPACYIQVSGMTISEMIQTILQMWKKLQRDEPPEKKCRKHYNKSNIQPGKWGSRFKKQKH